LPVSANLTILNSAENEETAATEVDVPEGTYHTIVIDPP